MYDTGRLTANGKRLLSPKYHPYYLDTPPIPVPCGKCVACLESRRREWIKRLALESTLHDSSSFITLTYDDKHLPSDGFASKSDVQRFLKRFRHAGRDYDFFMPPFKYFIVCEYGSKHGRPHYHGLIFGIDFYSPEWHPRLVSVDKYPRITSDVLASIWQNGFVLFDRLTMSNIQYVSKYVTKTGDNWSLKSIGLADALFTQRARANSLNNVCARSGKVLSSQGESYYKTGRISIPTSHGFAQVRIPRFVDRLVERGNPQLYEFVKQSRRDYVRNMVMPDISQERDHIIITNLRENQKRTLDNET